MARQDLRMFWKAGTSAGSLMTTWGGKAKTVHQDLHTGNVEKTQNKKNVLTRDSLMQDLINLWKITLKTDVLKCPQVAMI